MRKAWLASLLHVPCAFLCCYCYWFYLASEQAVPGAKPKERWVIASNAVVLRNLIIFVHISLTHVISSCISIHKSFQDLNFYNANQVTATLFSGTI